MGLLRFILAITVVLTHSTGILGLKFVGGHIAVQAFYIISGFYMTLILNEKYIGQNSSYKLFITNRLLRLFPIYWCILGLTLMLGIVISIHSHGSNLGPFKQYALYGNQMSISTWIFLIFSNIFLFFQDVVMFLGLDISTGHLFFTPNFKLTNPMLYEFLFVPQAWTIGVEILFYLIAPFLVRRKLKVIIPLLLLSLGLRAVLYFNGYKEDPWSYRFFPTELLFFMMGIIAYHIYLKIKDKNIAPYLLKAILVGMLLFTISFSLLPFPGKYQLYLVCFGLALPFVFVLTKKWKRDAFIGELSYPIYISHIFVLACLRALHFPENKDLGLYLSIFSILFSLVLNQLITKRIERIRQKRVAKLASI